MLLVGFAATLLTCGCSVPMEALVTPSRGEDDQFSTVQQSGYLSAASESLEYSVGWNGIPGATFRIKTRQEKIAGRELLSIGFSGATSRTVEWAWRYRLNGVTYATPSLGLPICSARVSTENGDTDMTTLRFDRDQRSVHRVEKELQDGYEASGDSVSFQQGLDIPAALMFLRGLNWEPGCTHRIEIVEDEAQLVELTALRNREIKTPAGTFDAVEIQVRVEPARAEGQKGHDPGRYHGGRIWLSRDQRHVPLVLQAEVFVGYVYAELVNVETQHRACNGP